MLAIVWYGVTQEGRKQPWCKPVLLLIFIPGGASALRRAAERVIRGGPASREGVAPPALGSGREDAVEKHGLCRDKFSAG